MNDGDVIWFEGAEKSDDFKAWVENAEHDGWYVLNVNDSSHATWHQLPCPHFKGEEGNSTIRAKCCSQTLASIKVSVAKRGGRIIERCPDCPTSTAAAQIGK